MLNRPTQQMDFKRSIYTKQRIIILKPGSANGFRRFIISAKEIKYYKVDYHEEITGELFQKCSNKIFNNTSKKWEVIEFLYEQDILWKSSTKKKS